LGPPRVSAPTNLLGKERRRESSRARLLPPKPERPARKTPAGVSSSTTKGRTRLKGAGNSIAPEGKAMGEGRPFPPARPRGSTNKGRPTGLRALGVQTAGEVPRNPWPGRRGGAGVAEGAEAWQTQSPETPRGIPVPFGAGSRLSRRTAFFPHNARRPARSRLKGGPLRTETPGPS